MRMSPSRHCWPEPSEPKLMSGQARDCGFTILEGLVALVILAFAAFAIMPMTGRDRSSEDVDGVAVKISALLKAAQAKARKTNSEQHVEFDAGQRRLLWRGNRASVGVPPQLSLRFESAKDGVSGLDGARQHVRFSHDGSSNGAVIVLKSPGRTARVTTDWLTGETRLSVSTQLSVSTRPPAKE